VVIPGTLMEPWAAVVSAVAVGLVSGLLVLSAGIIGRLFVDPIPAQHMGLRQVLRDFPADVIIGDNMICGVLPMLRTALETAPHCSLWHIDFALAP
jgi:hypothetical protein